MRPQMYLIWPDEVSVGRLLFGQDEWRVFGSLSAAVKATQEPGAPKHVLGVDPQNYEGGLAFTVIHRH